MADEFNLLCPTCHSRIGKIEGEEVTIGTKRGELGTDDDGLPVPKWSDDPILTTDGFSGPIFIGETRKFADQIQEIQDERIQQEIDAGFNESQKTAFSEIIPDESRPLERQLIELRESTEKLLNIAGITLEEYFKVDANGQEALEPGPKDTFKNEWTDIERGRPYLHNDNTESGTFILPDSTEQQSPSVPANTRMKAIHLEDLRRFLLRKWKEFWTNTIFSLNVRQESNLLVRNNIFKDFREIFGGGFAAIWTKFETTDKQAVFDVSPLTIRSSPQTTVTTIPGLLGGNGTVTTTTTTTPISPTNANDIRPSDGGIRSVNSEGSAVTPPAADEPYYDGERTWFVDTIAADASFFQDVVPVPFPAVGPPGDALSTATADSVISGSPGSLTITTSTVGTEILNPTVAIALGGGARASSRIQINHNWGGGFPGLEVPETFKVTQNTRFRATLNTSITSAIPPGSPGASLTPVNSVFLFNVGLYTAAFGPFVDTTPSFFTIGVSFVGAAGMRLRVGDFNLFFAFDTSNTGSSVTESNFDTAFGGFEEGTIIWNLAPGNIVIDLKLDDLLVNAAIASPTINKIIYTSQTLPNPTSLEFEEIEAVALAKSTGQVAGFGALSGTVQTSITLSEMQIDETPKP